MHNLDRTRLEGDFDNDEFEYESEFEYDDEYEDEEDEFEYEYEAEAGGHVFDEAEELELAAELLEVTDDEELEQFLGRALKRGFRKLRRKARRALRSPLGRRLRKGLRKVARGALSNLGRAAGGAFGGPLGAALGGRIARGAGRAFGLELEGLSPEDQEFEVARRVVRMTGDAARIAASMPEQYDDEEAGAIAVEKAIARNAPGLKSGRGSAGASGKWVRKGRQIILIGV